MKFAVHMTNTDKPVAIFTAPDPDDARAKARQVWPKCIITKVKRVR